MELELREHIFNKCGHSNITSVSVSLYDSLDDPAVKDEGKDAAGSLDRGNREHKGWSSAGRECRPVLRTGNDGTKPAADTKVLSWLKTGYFVTRRVHSVFGYRTYAQSAEIVLWPYVNETICWWVYASWRDSSKQCDDTESVTEERRMFLRNTKLSCSVHFCIF